MTAGRVPNRRGEGVKLRGEIMDAARKLIEERGEKAVTLRSVARTAGIGAPSIYAHFPDCDAIISALVDEAFDELAALVTAASQRESDPTAKLRAACDTYVAFAIDRPSRFHLAFGARETNKVPRESATRAFTLLVNAVQECVSAGVSASIDPFADATAIWVALHGYAFLRTTRPAFPWPDYDTTLDRIIHALASISDPVDISRETKKQQ